MNEIYGMRTIKRAAAIIAAALFVTTTLATFAGSAAAQGEPVLDAHNASAAPGEEGTSIIGTHDIPPPGLAAWTVDVTYDPDVITAVRCLAEQGSVCNADFGPDTVRFAGGTAVGLEGETALGGLTFVCGPNEGTSPLTLTATTFADATVGGPQPIDATVIDGAFVCEDDTVIVERPPDAGAGFSSDAGGRGWGIELLVVAGFAALIFSSTVFTRRTR